jgi:hypothetical protein
MLVICSEETWHWHVLGGHPEMEGLVEEVKSAITDPLRSMVFQDRDYPARNIYYKRHTKFIYIKVVVEFTNLDNALITAYLTDSLKPGEKLLWMP